MSGNGHSAVLDWPGRVFSVRDLTALNGHHSIRLRPHAVLTPAAAEELRLRGIAVEASHREEPNHSASSWVLLQERPFALVSSVIASITRTSHLICWPTSTLWDRDVMRACQDIQRQTCDGAVVLTTNPSLAAAIANKMANIRAASIVSTAQLQQARHTLGANVIAVEMPGRTYFELCYMLKWLCDQSRPQCPPALRSLLNEMKT